MEKVCWPKPVMMASAAPVVLREAVRGPVVGGGVGVVLLVVGGGGGCGGFGWGVMIEGEVGGGGKKWKGAGGLQSWVFCGGGGWGGGGWGGGRGRVPRVRRVREAGSGRS